MFFTYLQYLKIAVKNHLLNIFKYLPTGHFIVFEMNQIFGFLVISFLSFDSFRSPKTLSILPINTHYLKYIFCVAFKANQQLK